MSTDFMMPFYDAFARPVTRDNVFFCSGDDDSDFYVELDRNRHRRADPHHLYNLLTYTVPPPLLTKKGAVAKRQPAPHKDETEHFYCAQLLHYGLKPLKSKAAAKKALLAAFGTGNSHTLQVPPNIKQLWQDLRKDYAVEVERARKERIEEEKAEAKKREEKKKEHAALMAEVLGEPKVGATGSKKRKGAPAKDTAPSKKSKGGKKLAATETSGQFEIVCPYIAEQWEEYAQDGFTLKMSPSRGTGRHLWMSFDFGVVTGVMRGGVPPLTANSPVSYSWRGSEEGEGVLTFGEDNVGSITFLGDGKIKGLISGSFLGDDVEFVGKKINKPNVMWAMSVKDWKENWRGINETSYERANVARWGKWVSDEGCDEGPAGSDTTEGEPEQGSDEERSSEYGYDGEYAF